MKIKEIAEFLGGEIEGDPEEKIYGFSSLEDARRGDISFVSEKRYVKIAEESEATCVIVPRDVKIEGKNLIKVDDPYLAFIKVVENFFPCEVYFPEGKNFFVSPTASIGDGSSIGDFSFIGENTKIGRNVKIGALVYIGKDVEIGDGSVIYPRVSILNASIGKNVIIQSGTVIGSDGFGYIKRKRWIKIPQRGRVVIEDDVEIGANVTIDRGTFGETRIKSGTKIDNLVHIAHNVLIQEDTILVAQVGIAGSAKIGRNVILAGQVGVGDHTVIEDGAVIYGKAGVFGRVKKGEHVSGFPPMPHRRWLKVSSLLRRLPEIVERMRSSPEK